MLPATELVEQDCPCAEDAALDRAGSTTADPSRLVVRQPGNSNQEECFSLAGGQPFKSVGNALKLEVVKLRRWAGELGRMVAVAVGYFATPGSQFPKVGIAQDCEEPSSQVRAFLEHCAVCPGFCECFLHEIICAIRVTSQGSGKGSKPRHLG